MVRIVMLSNASRTEIVMPLDVLDTEREAKFRADLYVKRNTTAVFKVVDETGRVLYKVVGQDLGKHDWAYQKGIMA